MEKELNIAAILKDKPKNTKLWTYIYGDVYLDGVNNIEGIKLGHHGAKAFLLSSGKAFEDGEVCIFPSKEMQDWSKFAWKKGDVLRCGVGNLCIFDSWANNNYTEFNAKYVTHSYANSTCPTKMWSKETNEDTIKQYISKIEEIKGGKLNLSTLAIKKQSKFKDGDFVTVYYSSKDKAIIIFKYDKSDDSKFYFYCALIKGKLYYNDYVVAADIVPRFYSKTEKEKFFAALAKENKAWDADKKMLVDLPKKCEFKAMDWCLMRDNIDRWKLCQFGFFHKENDFDSNPYNAVGGNWYNECIPYNDSTKHLLGTTDEWKGGEG